MSVRLRFRVSDYPFGIFKRFLSILIWFIISDISCKDIGAFQYSGPVHVICNIQNNLDVSTINISKDGVNIAQIENDDSNNPSVINENLDFSINDTNIIITIKNMTCNAGGVYTVVIIMINTTASAEARLFINREYNQCLFN
jgi:hypothetical protein